VGVRSGARIGLAISREFIRLMGGELTVTSRPGEGSLFRFVIPVSVAGPERQDEPPRDLPAAELAAGVALAVELPAALMDGMKDAVLLGDKFRLDELLAKAGTIDAQAADALKKLAETYEYDALISALEAAPQSS
jgi:hypothetical protein